MKKLLIINSIALLSVSSFAQKQTKENELSNAERFSEKSGALIQKEYIEIGKVKGCEVKVVQYSDLINSTKTSAVKLEHEYVSKYTTDTKTAVLDADEMDGLIKSIKIIQEKILPGSPVNYTEVEFKSRGGFSAGCFYSKGKWSAFLKLEKYDGNSYVWLSQNEFTELLALIEQAKAKL